MALSFQTSKLCLTLPISCQICLGKVRQPVICANHHVFCSSCMETWLQKAGQCPTCRVPITPENPCREILGGTNDSDHSESPSTRKCLRKTRGELLLREYEDEIEGLIRENEELKARNQSLETQLKTALDPCSIPSLQTDDRSVDSHVLEEWTNKLRASKDICDKVKQDMDKMKEANKALRSQNVDLVQENMRLRAEVASRSPQKFGRYTVAALEAKIQQYERDVDHLKKALERSDQYIEDLECRVRQSEKLRTDVQEAAGNGKARSDALTHQQKISMMMRSLSDKERGLICSNPEAGCRTFAVNDGTMFLPSADHKEVGSDPSGNQNGDDLGRILSDALASTPSSAFRSLTLRSPGVREKKVAFKPGSYLRRLDFDDIPSPSRSAVGDQFSSLQTLRNGLTSHVDLKPVKSAFWDPWQGPDSEDQEKTVKGSAAAEDSFQESSEASMDAAYLDKISELDSMMLEGESSSSRGSQLSLASSPLADLDHTLVPQPEAFAAAATMSRECERGARMSGGVPGGPADHGAPGGTDESFPLLLSAGEGGGSGSTGSSQTDELSFDLVFDPQEGDKAGRSRSLEGRGHEGPSSPCPPANTPRHTLSGGQPAKRKSHSPFNTSSPTKLSKLM